MVILTIAIPSYNRPNELLRTLNSIKIKNDGLIEVLIIDDCSPLQNEITRVISKVNHLKTIIKYIPLKNNIGFDENALNLVQNASGKYILFLTDDDIVNSEYLENLVYYLSITKSKLIVTAYKTSNSEICRVFKRSYQTKLISPKDYVKCIYNCILFSGIIVSRECFLELNISGVKGMIYSQVFWSILLASKYGVSYIKEPVITTIGDGALGWGTNQSEPENLLLADRSNLFSPIAYHRALLKTVQRAQELVKVKFYYRFLYEYSLRSYQLFIRAYKIKKRAGLYLFFRAFMREKLPLNKNYFFIYIYFITLFISGNSIEIFTKLFFSKSPAQLFKRIKNLD